MTDSLTGGEGPVYTAAIQALRDRFPYRKWLQHQGDFCGTQYSQDPETKIISGNQSKFVEKMKPVRLSRHRLRHPEAPATPAEIAQGRSCFGDGGWICKETRPDLSCQVSFGQSCFPQPTVGQLAQGAAMVRRAKQYADLSVKYLPIPASELTMIAHLDAAWGNAKGNGTQAGYVLGFTDRSMARGQEAPWTPFHWRSFRLKRLVPSTLAGEAQAASSCSAALEWMSLMLYEALEGPLDLRQIDSCIGFREPLLVTDCKSLYDTVTANGSPATLEDKRCAIDVVVIRDSLRRCRGRIRWVPTDRQLADSLTKDKGECADLLRACMRACMYQLSDEQRILQLKAQERENRKQRGAQRKIRASRVHGHGSTCAAGGEGSPESDTNVNLHSTSTTAPDSGV